MPIGLGCTTPPIRREESGSHMQCDWGVPNPQTSPHRGPQGTLTSPFCGQAPWDNLVLPLRQQISAGGDSAPGTLGNV